MAGILPPLALVTGAAHRLGKAIAIELAGHGFVIGLHYHTAQAEALQTAAEIAATGGKAELLKADLSDPEAIKGMFEFLDTKPYDLRILVNSAAVMSHNDLSTMDVSEWDATLNLNLRAPWLCAREAARRMSSGGVIINLTDSGAEKLWTSYPVYAISKNALEMLTRLLARVLSPSVRVNAVAPGLILKSTDMNEADWQKLIGRLPLKRAGTPQDVARAIWFLVENEHITGETIVVDGGYRLV